MFNMLILVRRNNPLILQHRLEGGTNPLVSLAPAERKHQPLKYTPNC
jgi:hypothetical protein